MDNKEYNIKKQQMGGGALKEDVGGGSTTLTPATADTLGGVKIGNGISVTEDGTISAQGGSGSVTSETFTIVVPPENWTKVGSSMYVYTSELEVSDDLNPSLDPNVLTTFIISGEMPSTAPSGFPHTFNAVVGAHNVTTGGMDAKIGQNMSVPSYVPAGETSCCIIDTTVAVFGSTINVTVYAIRESV